MSYLVRIDTSSYKLKACSKKNWVPGKLNNYMTALNGWHVTERSLEDVYHRISYLWGRKNYENPKFINWLDNRAARLTIKYRDVLCEIERVEEVVLPGLAMGYFDLDKYMDELKKSGYVKLPFSLFYDTRQDINSFKNCYIEVIKKD